MLDTNMSKRGSRKVNTDCLPVANESCMGVTTLALKTRTSKALLAVSEVHTYVCALRQDWELSEDEDNAFPLQ